MQEKQKGELYILFEVLLWAFFPIITTLTYASLPPLLSFAWSTLFSAIFFGGIVLYRKRWLELRNPVLWQYACYIAFFIGLLFYGFYFIGLSKTTPGNAALIAQFEVFATFIFFNVFRKEHISLEHKTGAAFMVVGAIIVLAPNFSGVNIGDFLILAATFCSPVGNLFQQKARKIASSETIMFLRTLLSAPIVFTLAYFVGIHASILEVRDSFWFLVINGALILGLSKILWIEGIHRMSVTKANALGSTAPVLTLILAWVFLQQVPSVWQLLALPPLFIGTLLLTDQFGLKSKNLIQT